MIIINYGNYERRVSPLGCKYRRGRIPETV